MPKEMTEDEILEEKRQEAISNYGLKISELKQQEINLQHSVNNLQVIIDLQNMAKIKELDALRDTLTAKLSEAEDLNIKNRELNSTYESKLAAFGIEKFEFQSQLKEKQEMIEKTINDLENEKNKLAGALAVHEVAASELQINKNEHALSIQEFNEQSVLLEAKNKDADELIAEARTHLALNKIDRESLAAELSDFNKIKDEYNFKNSELDKEREQLKILQVDCVALVDRLNKEKSDREILAVQLKVDRINLNKKFEELSVKQADINAQIEKLELLKDQMKKEI